MEATNVLIQKRECCHGSFLQAHVLKLPLHEIAALPTTYTCKNGNFCVSQALNLFLPKRDDMFLLQDLTSCRQLFVKDLNRLLATSDIIINEDDVLNGF